ncbi:glycosyltransferase [Vreelandella alkaliphila]|uniref:Glycosyltransferase n=1 Tax=Vreelandella alkaliphila TaxID=272774 RepID=A0ABX4HLA2_9GAMM|nr:hypothetical protein [Halomonas humidisoli]PAU73002.1 hypothetical protein CK497_07775 [Halomonas humidisoli]
MLSLNSICAVIEKSSLFDGNWYSRKYQDVQESGLKPLEHFVKYGSKLLRDPGPNFSSADYTARYSRLFKKGDWALLHYLLVGEKEGLLVDRSNGAGDYNLVEKNQVVNLKNDTVLNEKNSQVFVGIASIPQRVNCLEQTVQSLISQVDKIGVFLDKYSVVPEFLKNNEKITYKMSSDFPAEIGDAGKFYWVDNHEGFYFTCDDDLIYPENYIERITKKIQFFDYPVVVGWHGSVILEPFANYYDKDSRRVFSFGAPRPYDTPVHILGTGCMGFHTSHINVSFSDFKTPNMADVYFAVLGQQQNIPFIVAEHKKGEIFESDASQEFSIYQHSSKSIEGSRHNTKEKQNEIVSKTKWNVNYVNRNLKILIVGRFKINVKGGVYKSSHLLKDGLEKIGHTVDICCLSELNERDFDKNYDFCLAYAPDPNRPDFGDCINSIKFLARNGCVCAVNLSFNLNKERTSWVENKLWELNSEFKKPKIFFASFSNSTQYFFKEKTREMIVPFPKTISLNRYENKGYEHREGIFLGDLAKLNNSSLVNGNLSKWIEQIRIKLPHVNIYVLKHYHTNEVPLNYLKVIPYTQDIGRVLNKFRLTVCLVPGATFEMVPLESMVSGTPVIHREMPQSLSEYLSPLSVEVSSPIELGEVCKNLYEREDIWSRISSAGYNSLSFFEVNNVIADIDIAIRKVISRSNA